MLASAGLGRVLLNIIAVIKGERAGMDQMHPACHGRQNRQNVKQPDVFGHVEQDKTCSRYSLVLATKRSSILSA